MTTTRKKDHDLITLLQLVTECLSSIEECLDELAFQIETTQGLWPAEREQFINIEFLLNTMKKAINAALADEANKALGEE